LLLRLLGENNDNGNNKENKINKKALFNKDRKAKETMTNINEYLLGENYNNINNTLED